MTAAWGHPRPPKTTPAVRSFRATHAPRFRRAAGAAYLFAGVPLVALALLILAVRG